MPRKARAGSQDQVITLFSNWEDFGVNANADAYGSYQVTTPGGKRTVSGKKGLGKLALFGIGHEIEVSTTRANQRERLIVTMDWNVLIETDDGDYEPLSRTEPAELAERARKTWRPGE